MNAPSVYNAESSALPFASHQDALDFANHSAEHSNRILAANNLVNVIERYRKGDIEMKVALNLAGVENGSYYHLVFFAVPSIIHKQSGVSDGDITTYPDASTDRDGVKHFMLGDVTQLVQCPKGVIPSFVRVEPFKQTADFRWQILASAGCVIPHITLRWPERKLGGFGVIGSGLLTADGECDLIEHGAKVVGTIENDMGKLIGEAISESDLKGFARSLDVFLDDWGPSVYLSVCPKSS